MYLDLSPVWGLCCKEKLITVPQGASFIGWARSQSSARVVLYKTGSHLVHKKTWEVKKIKTPCRGVGRILVKKHYVSQLLRVKYTL